MSRNEENYYSKVKMVLITIEMRKTMKTKGSNEQEEERCALLQE